MTKKRQPDGTEGNACVFLAVMILGFPILVIGLVAVYVGIDAIAGWVTRWVLDQPIVLGLIGAGILLFSAWALGRVITRAPTLGIPLRQVLLAGVLLVGMGLFGLLALWTAITNKPGAPGF
jgi:hypothetical protein